MSQKRYDKEFKLNAVKLYLANKDTKSIRVIAEDLVQQNFTAPVPNSVWVADISYIAVNNKWVYLSIVLDLFSRKVVGIMALEETMKSELVIKALNAATYMRKPAKGLIHHSDLGGQFTRRALYKTAKKLRLKNRLKNNERHFLQEQKGAK